MQNALAEVRRFESRFTTADGASLFRRAWFSPEPRVVLLLIHGFAEHSGRYEDFGQWFAARGCSVHSFDHRGHGSSPGPRNYVRRFEEFLDDVATFEQLVCVECPDLPMVLVGHSMGGLICAAYACGRPTSVRGLALSGAALMVPPLPMLQRLMIRVLGRLWPRRTFASGIEPEALSRDPEVVRRYVEDPLIDPRITVSLAAEMMAAAGRIAGRGADVPLPVLLLHGESDSICSPAGSESFFAARTLSESKGTAGESGRQYWNRLHVYPELRHEIFNEPEREAVFGDLLKWVDELGRAQTPGDHGMEGSPENG